jgi:hypothetical protein
MSLTFGHSIIIRARGLSKSEQSYGNLGGRFTLSRLCFYHLSVLNSSVESPRMNQVYQDHNVQVSAWFGVGGWKPSVIVTYRQRGRNILTSTQSIEYSRPVMQFCTKIVRFLQSRYNRPIAEIGDLELPRAF